MSTNVYEIERIYFSHSPEKTLEAIGPDGAVDLLRRMLMIRNFEIRAESAYLQGKIGGFFHSYIGQEAIQVGAVGAMGEEQWYTTTYRCHALALLLGVSPESIMAELYGRATGNALGRGGSMHLFSERLLGGYGIVGGQVPVATGAGFTLKYRGDTDHVSVCFLGDGAVAQGAFHEALNLASLWNLPCIYVIENNVWGMGTAYDRAISVEHIAEAKAPGYAMKGYTFDGTDLLNCYAGFKKVFDDVRSEQRPVLIEAVAERFKGHSISDPGAYRSKEQLQCAMKADPILKYKQQLIEAGYLTEERYGSLDKEMREIAVEAMKRADEAPWPSLSTLEEDVFANG